MGVNQHGLSGEKIKLNHHGSNEKLPIYNGGYISPNGEREYMYQNPQYDHQQINMPSRMKNGGSKIGTGALKKQPSNGQRVPSGQDGRKLQEITSPKKAGG